MLLNKLGTFTAYMSKAEKAFTCCGCLYGTEFWTGYLLKEYALCHADAKSL